MPTARCFRLPRLLLPRADLDLRRWSVIACDQYTSDPDYWTRVAAEVVHSVAVAGVILFQWAARGRNPLRALNPRGWFR